MRTFIVTALVVSLFLCSSSGISYANSNESRNDFKTIIESLKNELVRNPGDDILMARIGEVYFSKIQNQEKAVEWFKRAIAINSNNPYYHQRLGQSYSFLKQYALSTKHFSRALDYKPEDGQIHYLLSVALTIVGQGEKAWNHLKQAEQIFIRKENPDGVYVVRDLMKGLNQQNRFAKDHEFETFYKLDFGYIEPGTRSREIFFKKTSEIPLRTKHTGLRWGYRIQSSDDEIHSTQFIIRPPLASVKTSGDLEKKGTILDKGKAVKSFPQGFKEKLFCPFWFDEGDPKGKWEIDIFIDNKLTKTVKFNVK